MEPIRSTMFSGVSTGNTVVSTGRTGIGKIVITNDSGAVAFVQFFEATPSAVTVGTTVPALAVALADNETYDMDFNPSWYVEDTICVFSTVAMSTTVGSAAGIFIQAWVN